MVTFTALVCLSLMMTYLRKLKCFFLQLSTQSQGTIIVEESLETKAIYITNNECEYFGYILNNIFYSLAP